LCKHLVALAIRAVTGGSPLSEKDRKMVIFPESSNRKGVLGKSELSSVRSAISDAMRYIKAYSGSSRTWFAYQASLMEGCNRLAALFSDLPVSEQTAQLIVQTLLRLDEKLCRGGVDDSDGTVGGLIEGAVDMLIKYAELDPACIGAFQTLKGRSTCFDWEEPLLNLVSH